MNTLGLSTDGIPRVLGNRSVKILHVIPSLGIGGTEKIVYELCKNLSSPEFCHRVVSLKFGGPTEQALREIGVPVDLLQSCGPFWSGLFDMPRLFFRLRETMKEFQPQIVHTWLVRANAIGRIAARSLKLVPVLSSLRVIEEEKSYHLWAESLTSGWSKAVTVNCTALEEFAVQKIGIPKEKIRLIYNGIDLDQLKVDSAMVERFRKEWVLAGEVVIGTMGRLHRQKGIDIFLKAGQGILKIFPNARLLIAGDGPERRNLEALAQKLGIQEKVRFCGWIQNSKEFLSLSDVFVLASRWEGMPNVLLEAMALKRPVVATQVGGAADLIESEKEGLLIPTEAVQSCISAVERLIHDPSLRRSLAENGYRKVEREFSVRAMSDAYRKLYESLL